MITKIKNDLKKVGWFCWVTFGVAVVALFIATTHVHHKGPGPKGHKATEAVEVAK